MVVEGVLVVIPRTRIGGLQFGQIGGQNIGGQNIGGAGNYVILEAAGRGHYVGCNLNVTNLRATEQWNWYGEGDDMIWIDQDQ